jgi:hypothetical protein
MSTAVNLSEIARRRHTSKAFDPSRTIPAETMDQLRTLLRYAPSSVNSQPWHFVIACCGRQGQGGPGPQPSHNTPKVAAHGGAGPHLGRPGRAAGPADAALPRPGQAEGLHVAVVRRRPGDAHLSWPPGAGWPRVRRVHSSVGHHGLAWPAAWAFAATSRTS